MKNRKNRAHWYFITAILLVLIGILPNQCFAKSADAEECEKLALQVKDGFLSKAYARIREEIIPLAIETCSRQIANQPNDVDSIFWRGIVYYQFGFDKNEMRALALDDFSTVLSVQPNDVQALENRAVLYNFLKRYSDAVNDATNAIKIDIKSVTAYMARGRARYNLEQYQGSADDFTKALELKPESFTMETAYYERAKAYVKLGKTEMALADFKSEIAMNPEQPDNYVHLAEYLTTLSRNKEAIAAWQDMINVIEKNPKYANIYKNDLEKARQKIRLLEQKI